MKLAEEYSKRPMRFLDLWAFDDWTLKAYGITYGNRPLSQNLVDAAYLVTRDRLSASAHETMHYGVGFVGIHQGKTGNFVFVDWWADENELHHHVYVSTSTQPAALEYKTPFGLAACVWDLFLIGHERDAWVKHVLMQSKMPDLQGYLNARLCADV